MSVVLASHVHVKRRVRATSKAYYVCGNSCLTSTNSRLVLPDAPSPRTNTLRAMRCDSRCASCTSPHSVISIVSYSAPSAKSNTPQVLDTWTIVIQHQHNTLYRAPDPVIPSSVLLNNTPEACLVLSVFPFR